MLAELIFNLKNKKVGRTASAAAERTYVLAPIENNYIAIIGPPRLESIDFRLGSSGR